MNQSNQEYGAADWLRHKTRHFWNRPHLSTSALIFLGLLFALCRRLSLAGSLLVAFDVAAAIFLLATAAMMARATPSSMKSRARLQQEGKWVVLGLCVIVALVVLVALSLELHAGRNASTIQVILAASTIVISWVFVNTMFALHYAHAYYDDSGATAAGLEFPGTQIADYWDFMYFAFVLGMTFQVSDVQISSRSLRRLVLLQSVIAFFFNVVIIALTVNVIAGTV